MEKEIKKMKIEINKFEKVLKTIREVKKRKTKTVKKKKDKRTLYSNKNKNKNINKLTQIVHIHDVIKKRRKPRKKAIQRNITPQIQYMPTPQYIPPVYPPHPYAQPLYPPHPPHPMGSAPAIVATTGPTIGASTINPSLGPHPFIATPRTTVA